MGSLDAAAVATRFDLGQDARLGDETARGELGQVRRLDTDRGAFAVKETFAPLAADDAQRTGDFQATCHRAGVACPRPCADVEGRYLADVGGADVRVQTWVDVVDPDPLLDAAAVGETLARLHAVVVPATAPPNPWTTDPVGAETWRGLCKSARGAGAPYVERLATLVPDLLATETLLTPMAAEQVLHLDLWADNLRSRPDGSPLVIDFDNAGAGDPSRELAMVLFEFGRWDGDRLRTLAAAYAETGGPGRVTGREDFALTVAQLHHIAVHQIRGWLGARDPEGRARAHAAVRELLDEPLLLDGIDRILDELAS